jgi:hypothetical protein
MSDEVAAWKARIYQLNRMRADIDAEHRELCKRQGLLTDKPVTGPACNLQRPWEAP